MRIGNEEGGLISKPIEPGCLAWVYGLIKSVEFNGLLVRVERRVYRGDLTIDCQGRAAIYEDRPSWLCSCPDWKGEEPFGARNLRRIDDFDNTEITEKEAELTQ